MSPEMTAGLGLVTQGASALSGMAGSYYGAKTTQINARAAAAIAETNARIAETGAQTALMRGQQQVAASTLRAGMLKGRQRAALAANGVDLGEGSAAELQASTDIMSRLDAQTIELNAIFDAWGYRTSAASYMNDALSQRALANTTSPFGAAMTSLLGSASGVAPAWQNFQGVRAASKTDSGPGPWEGRPSNMTSTWG